MHAQREREREHLKGLAEDHIYKATVRLHQSSLKM